jgi:hypothetical protein
MGVSNRKRVFRVGMEGKGNLAGRNQPHSPLSASAAMLETVAMRPWEALGPGSVGQESWRLMAPPQGTALGSRALV